MYETMKAIGHYTAWCVDVDGHELWRAETPNLVATVGKNHLLDNYLAASAFSNTNYMGLITSVSFTGVANGDTMTSHSGWLEGGLANAPTYSGSRPTCAWAGASAGAKALSAALSFAITGTGTVKGVFIVLGSGASATIDNTGGVLFSAGLFTGGDQAVVNTNTVNVSYSVSV